MYERGRRVGNILSYLKWRGDLTFKERAFCEVDNLVLAELAYIDFSGIVPEQGTGISVREAAERFYGCGRENLGMVPIITSGLTLWHYVYASGSFILLYGIGRILHAMYINGKQNMMQRERGQVTENISQTKL